MNGNTFISGKASEYRKLKKMNMYFDISSSEMKTLTPYSISTLYSVEVKSNFGVLEQFFHENDGS